MPRSNNSKTPPYLNLGNQLNRLRQDKQESEADVSDAVEIDIELLKRIEQGRELPSEDILLMLINHFGICDDDAVRLWELAGYDERDISCDHDNRHEETQRLTKQPVLMVLGMDARIMYSNGFNISIDPSGVVMNFMQYSDPTQPALPVSRVGMSRDQAQKILDVLSQALLNDKYSRGPKNLPAPQQTEKTSDRSKKKA